MARTAYTPVLIPVVALAMLVGGCTATPKPRTSQVEEWHPPSEMLEKYADKNGVVTRAAMEAGLRADFAVADVHHTGCLDQDEVRAINEERWKEDASTSSPLIDFRHNGCIDFDEFAATPRSLFDQLDKKGTGRLTPQQLHPGRRAQAQNAS
jgi:hypothetical protein